MRFVAWAVIGASLIFLNVPRAGGCLWDSDTLATEAQGVPETVWVILGRFERNPPLYYELRLRRAAKAVTENANDLAAYDDAGVACDRLGRGDDAIGWMARKRDVLDRLAEQGTDTDEHRYRYLANVGTFWVHRWARNGADRTKLDEMKTARDFIAEALRLNPNAHFGRERYQLRILEWIIDPPPLSRDHPKGPLCLHDLHTQLEASSGKDSAHDAVRGLTGLVALGNAWESVDVFNALIEALDADEERTCVAWLARWRCEELVAGGRKSVRPGAPVGELLKEALARPPLDAGRSEELAATFRNVRAEADAWHASRTAYMQARLEEGRHPDTDSTFWFQYKSAETPRMDALMAEMAAVARSSQASVPSSTSSSTPRPLGEDEVNLEVSPTWVVLALGGCAAVAVIVIRARSAHRSETASR